jgi:hypothetical protein
MLLELQSQVPAIVLNTESVALLFVLKFHVRVIIKEVCMYNNNDKSKEKFQAKIKGFYDFK